MLNKEEEKHQFIRCIKNVQHLLVDKSTFNKN